MSALTIFCGQIAYAQSTLSAIIASELYGGIVLDTAFFNFCFSDSPDKFNEKLSTLILTKQIQSDSSGKMVLYTFICDKLFAGLSFTLKPAFRNNSLAELRLDFIPNTKQIVDNNFVTINQFEKLLEQRYGSCSLIDSTTSITNQPEKRFYWVKGNRKIYFVGVKEKPVQPDMLSLNFADTRNKK